MPSTIRSSTPTKIASRSPSSGADRRHAPHVRARLLDRREVRGAARRAPRASSGSDVGPVGDRVVVEHARQLRRADDGREVRQRLAPVRRGRRRAAGPSGRRSPSPRARRAVATASAVESAATPGDERGAARRAPPGRPRARRPSPSNVSVADSPSEPSGTKPRQPAASIASRCRGRKSRSSERSSRNGVVIAGKTPCHFMSLLLRATRWPSGAGRTGGRTVSESQPKRNSSAGPQTRPWHGPMPARGGELGLARARRRRRGAARRTSSQRQTIVSGRASAPQLARADGTPAPSRRRGGGRRVARARRPPLGRRVVAPRGREPRDLPLRERDVDARDAARLARAGDAGHAGLLPRVHGDGPARAPRSRAAARAPCSARDRSRPPRGRRRSRCARRAVRRRRRSRGARARAPRATQAPVRYGALAERRAVARRLEELRRGAPASAAREPRERAERRLLRDERDLGAGLRERRGHGKQQRARARPRRPCARRATRPTSRAPARRRRPARPAASSPGTAGRARARPSRGRAAAPSRRAAPRRRLARRANAAASRDARRRRSRRRRAGRPSARAARSTRARPPAARAPGQMAVDLSARREPLVEHDRARARTRPRGRPPRRRPVPRRRRRRRSRAPRARSGPRTADRGPLEPRVATSMPSRTSSMQARRCGTPSIVDAALEADAHRAQDAARLARRPSAADGTTPAFPSAAATVTPASAADRAAVDGQRARAQACAAAGKRRASARTAPDRSGSSGRGSRRRRAAPCRAPS